ncbi:PASTA domain-containing protein [Parapedobacter deserti]|uniref:PASTA domain-containing protein n=1 Tax=Parapedobacter deserti TaxID=1912957 RepID=A0ABV7JLA8_9SPHI
MNKFNMNKFFQYLRTDTFRKNLIGALIGLTVFFLLIVFGLRQYTRHNESVIVPELKGLLVDDAIKTLQAQGFEYDVDSVYQVDAKPGLVIEQDPDPATKVKKNRTLYLTIITRTAPEVAFPDLIEKTFVEARAILNSYGLKLGDTTYIPDIARDVVLDVKFGGERLNAGRPIPKGSTVGLVLGDGRGANEVVVPDLIGLTLEQVRFALQGNSLTLGTVNYMGPVTDSLSATVISQTPTPEDPMVSIGTPINIALANE